MCSSIGLLKKTSFSGYNQIGPKGPPHSQATIWSILVDTQQKLLIYFTVLFSRSCGITSHIKRLRQLVAPIAWAPHSRSLTQPLSHQRGEENSKIQLLKIWFCYKTKYKIDPQGLLASSARSALSISLLK